MKQRIAILITTLLATLAAMAQTMNIEVGQTTYQIPAAQAGEMVYEDGTTLTVMGREYRLTDISRIYIDHSEVADNTVRVVYTDDKATVFVAGNVSPYVTATVSGAHVSIEQSADVDDNVGEITYNLSGSSSDGEFYMDGSYKATVELDGLTLTNETPVYSGAAICIMDGKRIDLSVKKGTREHPRRQPLGRAESRHLLQGTP